MMRPVVPSSSGPGTPASGRSGRRTARAALSALAGAAALCVAAAGCASGGPASGASPGNTPSSSSSTRGAAPPGASTPAPSPPPPSPTASRPTRAQLAAALVTAADLGPPFVKEPDSGSGGSGTVSTSGCPALDSLLNASGGGAGGDSQRAAFDGGSYPVYVGEFLESGDAASVSSSFTQLRSAFQTCTSWVWKDSRDGTVLTFALSPITFGDAESTAVRLDGRANGVQINGYLAFEDLGTVLLGYVFFQTGSGSSQSAYLLYGTAVTKAEQVLGVQPTVLV